MSLAKDIAVELGTRLGTISIASDFLTDAGVRVFRGKRKLDPDDLPCIVLTEGPDKVESKGAGGNVKLAQRYIAEAHDACDTDHPNDKAHDLIEDMKRAVFAGDLTMGRRVSTIEYLGRTIGTREDGIALVFASIEFDVMFTEDVRQP